MKLKIILAITAMAIVGCDSQGPFGSESALGTSGTVEGVQGNAANTTVTERYIPINRAPFVPCLNERLTITGTRYLRITTTTDARGGTHVRYLLNDRGWEAVGQTSGNTWTLVAGMAPMSMNTSGTSAQANFTWAGAQLFRSSDPHMPSIQFRGPEHFTVNAIGEVVNEFNKYEYFICQGGSL